MIRSLLLVGASALATVSVTIAAVQGAGLERGQAPVLPGVEQRVLLDRYCVGCHNQKAKIAGLTLDTLDLARPGEHAEAWEKVVRKLRAGVMPPAGRPRPEPTAYEGLRLSLEQALDRAAAANPNPGRPAALHRLNRTEYRNAVRDLLALDLDIESWLPADPASYGFDNVGDILGISPVLLERYLASARRISRLAIGDPALPPSVDAYVVPSDLTQRDRLDPLPFGTRGGLLTPVLFPLDGEYVFKLRLARDFNENINGLTEPHQIELTLDGERVQLFTIGGTVKGRERGQTLATLTADDALQVRMTVRAGTRLVGAAFLKRPSVQFEDIRQPFLRDTVEQGDTEGQPALSKITISGPYGAHAATDTTPRRRILICRPNARAGEAACARQIISALARRAYRRPVTAADMDLLLRFYEEGRAAGGFEKGIEQALTRILVSPSFLFRIARDPDGAKPGTNYRITTIELASRLSFFLWSSIPDEALLRAAERGTLAQPAVLDREVRRMLAHPKAAALVNNFAGQWLYLRNLRDAKPDRRAFPDFDENLRRALRKETELFVDSIIREDRSVLDLLAADYTFVNERLARHYGIPHVYGDHFRRVTLTDPVRGGLAGQGSILTVRSYANRTSAVLRGVWILDNLLGVTVPPPPPNVPDLEETNAVGKVLSMRERTVLHRANPACASCHSVIDPIGLSLENFDAIGRWRAAEASGTPIDAAGMLPDGTSFDGLTGLKQALLHHSDQFVHTLTEKLMIYALGRGLEYYDAPAIRAIVRDAAAEDFRFSALIRGIVRSVPFQMRRSLDAQSDRTSP
ncbi:MAG TPA: DUF1592 domain-containing protein [Vicinamibacterales bacterium]|nr:DUF1592 domain-containing protein [Vicinamibacterales bacterium]